MEQQKKEKKSDATSDWQIYWMHWPRRVFTKILMSLKYLCSGCLHPLIEGSAPQTSRNIDQQLRIVFSFWHSLLKKMTSVYLCPHVITSMVMALCGDRDATLHGELRQIDGWGTSNTFLALSILLLFADNSATKPS